MQKINFLVLNYNRPKETELCLRSIKNFTQFPNYNIILLNNGGEDSDLIYDFYKQGLIDKLILNRVNNGCGLGMRQLFWDFDLDCDYVVMVQCDQFMRRPFTQDELNSYINILEEPNTKVKCIDLAGNQAQGRYSERAHLISKKFYNSIENTIGGPGMFSNYIWTEQTVHEHFIKNGYSIHRPELLFADNGKVSIREYPCGGVLAQFTDTKQVFIIKSITKRIDFPNVHFNDEEWDLILNNKWVQGTIPVWHIKDSFTVWQAPLTVDSFK